MILTLIKEFVAICEYLKKNQVKRKYGCYIVDRAELEAMLDKNKYLPSRDKLQAWKRLNWIRTDEERLTKRFYHDGKYKAMIFVCENVFLELKRLRLSSGKEKNAE